MSLLGILGGLTVVLLLAIAGFVIFGMGTGEQQDIVRAERGNIRGSFRGSTVRTWNQRFLRTRLGDTLNTHLVQANVRQLYAIEYLALALGTTVLVFFYTRQYIALFYSAVLAALVLWGFWQVLNVLKERQREKFIQQLPEFARIMANSTGAGLSIATALGVAAQELPDPAGRELTALKRELELGASLDNALERMAARIPGRDLDVLVSTLVISQRSGGSLIKSLRGMSDTLEFRKETKREVKTLVSQSSYTGYLVAGFGVGFVLLLSAFNNDLLYKMTSTIVGQIALIFAGICYGIGIIAIRKLIKVKL